MEQEKRKLPIIDIAGVPFYADATRMTISEVGNADNSISIFEMLILEDHLEFQFDKRTKTLFEERWDSPYDENNVETVWIRPIEATDPEGMKQLMDQAERNWQDRFPKDLPEINIGGTNFYVDGTRHCFRDAGNNWNIIPFSEVVQGESPYINFDLNVKNIPFPHELSGYGTAGEFPQHIIRVEMPNGQHLAEIIENKPSTIADNEGQRLQRQPPLIPVEGTSFFVDVHKEELRQAGNPENTIPFSEMLYSRNGYVFDYDRSTNNIADLFSHEYETVHLPNMTKLDPKGMAERFGLTVAEVQGKADVDLMVDQKQLALRENGLLPVIEIYGHTFYVDLFMGSLRPKDDFSTLGIRFDKIDEYYFEQSNAYQITYNPATHALHEIDYENITAIPKGIVVVEIPLQEQLDPVSYSRLHGFDKDMILRANPLQMEMKAKVIPWEQTPIKRIIADNLKRELEKQQVNQSVKSQRKKGRRL